MKTLKEYEQEKIDREQNFLRAMQEEDLKFLEEIEARNIPLYEQTDDKSTYRGEMIEKMRDDLRFTPFCLEEYKLAMEVCNLQN